MDTLANNCNTQPSCSFCSKFGDGTQAQGAARWYDEILAESRRFVAVAGLGALTPGYVLIVAKAHLLSMATIDDGSCDDFLRFRTEVVSRLSRVYGPMCVFEHGSAVPSSTARSCIEHAHLHLCPTSDEFSERFSRSFDLQRFTDFWHARETLRGNSYLYLEKIGEQPTAALLSGSVDSQVMRRLLASSLGLADFWDWAAYPNLANVRSTIAAFKESRAEVG